MSQRDKYGLTPKQRRFCDFYLADPERNATQAYMKAFPRSSKKSAGVTASQTLDLPNVAAYIAQAVKKSAKRAEADSDRVIKEMACVALSDIRKLFDADGRLLPLHKMDEDTTAAIQSMDVAIGDDGCQVLKVKFWPKGQALEQLGKVHGLFTEKLEVSGGGGLAEMMERHQKRKTA
ncbi:MAG: terminase small subunit [Magnetococcales bacterium]|nr:terminase small subunit [Magnetococcales bacterium]